MNSEEVKLEIERQIEEGRKKLFDDVATQLEKEKEAALMEARQKEVSILNWGLLWMASETKHVVRYSCFYFLQCFGSANFQLNKVATTGFSDKNYLGVVLRCPLASYMQ